MANIPGSKIPQAFCYLRSQYPEQKSDYIEEIKYDPDFAVPDEVLIKLRAVHKAIATKVKEVGNNCAICFSLQVGAECYVCACRARTVKNERPYLVMRAFIVTTRDLENSESPALAIGETNDWEALEAKKLPMMEVAIRPLNLQEGTHERLVNIYAKILRGDGNINVVDWPDQITYQDVMLNVRTAFQQLEPAERSRKNVAIGLPKDIKLPLKMDLCIEQVPLIPVSTQTQTMSKQNNPTSEKQSDLLILLEESLNALAMALRKAKPRPEDQNGWRLERLWNFVEDILSAIADLHRQEKGVLGPAAMKRAVKLMDGFVERLTAEFNKTGYHQQLEEPLKDVEAAMNNLGKPTFVMKFPRQLLDKLASLSPRSIKAWAALAGVLCLGIGAAVVLKLKGASQEGKPPPTAAKDKKAPTGDSSGGTSSGHPGGADVSKSQEPSNPLAALVANYSFDALNNLFPEDIGLEEKQKIQGFYAEMTKRQQSAPNEDAKHKIRLEDYNKIANALSTDEQQWLTQIEPALKRLAISPQIWAKLGPKLRLDREQWKQIDDLEVTEPVGADGDKEFKRKVNAALTPAQRKIAKLSPQ